MAWILSHDRRRVSVALLVIALAVVLVGVALFQGSGPPAGSPPPARQVPPAAAVAQLRYILFLLMLLILLLGISLLVILRWSRHFRRMILRRPAPPTAAEDVWAMHRLPQDAEEPPEYGRESEEP